MNARIKTGVVHVPADLFDLAGLDAMSTRAAQGRRLLVTLCLVHGGLGGRKVVESESEIARACWSTDPRALSRPGRTTVVTVLTQLRVLGVIVGFDAVEGGYDVELVKEAA